MARRGRKLKKVANNVKDRHVSGFMVRVPDVYRDLIRKAGDPDLAYTVKVRRALDDFLRKSGIEPPILLPDEGAA